MILCSLLMNETGITRNIDILLNEPFLNFDEFRKAFEKIGFLFVQDEKEMKIMIIRDAQPLQ